jgi:ABC-2 type transport system ATP-binding protein
MEEIDVDVLDLVRCFNGQRAVDGISFKIPQGNILGLLGPNGAGKSTTIKMLTTLLRPTSGTAKLMGYDILKEAAEVRRLIGYVPQQLSADGELTAYENLLITSKLYGLTPDVRNQRMDELLDFMQLAEFANRLVKHYSGGMIRKLEFALALIHRPPILFLDEPTVGLDPSAKRTLWYLIKELRRHFKTTILITTHDMDEADFLCDQVAFLHRGSLLVIESPEKLKLALGPHASLDDVFVHYAGTSIQEGGNYSDAKKIRKTISRLD